MNYRHFGEYVASFSQFENRLALTIRPSLKIERVTYAQLQRRAYRVAHYLRAQGVNPGDRIMVIGTNSPPWIELLLGTQLIGAVLVPVDASSSSQTVQTFLGQTEPKLIFRSQALQSELDASFPTRLLDTLDSLIAEYPDVAPDLSLSGDQPAVVVFTSGTTADPKGVVLTQHNILANISGIQTAIAVDPDWRLLSVLPLSHMYELTGSLAILSRGASIFYMPRVTPIAIARSLKEYQITTMLAIPQLLILLKQRIKQGAAEAGKTKTLALAFQLARGLPFGLRRWLFHSVHARLGGHLKLVVTGGAPIPLDVALFWEAMGVKMVQGYGLTETAPILSVNGLDDRRLNSPGRALENVQLRIAENGEIQAKGPNVFRGYLDNPTASKAAFTGDGWFKTGDVGHLQSGGWLQIQGRLKFAIVRSSGLKVFPEDIEEVMEKQPAFQMSCIVGIKGDDGESVEAVIISEGSDEEVNRAIKAINGELESFQHIDGWRRWPDSDFPRTRLLKVDRRRVQDWANAPRRDKGISQPSASAGVDPLLTIIRLSLGDQTASFGESDVLADIGLDSLRRLNVAALVEEQLSVAIPEDKVTGSLSVAGLRTLIKNGSRVETARPRATWPYRPLVRLLGSFVRDTLVWSIVRLWVRLRVEGLENLASLKTPAIFIFNHTDDFDGPVVYRALPRRFRARLSVAAAADVLSEHKLLALLIRFCFAGFDFARTEPYRPSLEYFAERIDQGWSVAIAPEGRLSPTPEMLPFKSGIGLLAVSLGVPVVPVKTIGLRGTVPIHAKWPKKHSQVTVRIGQPQQFKPDENYDTVTETLQKIMEKL